MTRKRMVLVVVATFALMLLLLAISSGHGRAANQIREDLESLFLQESIGATATVRDVGTTVRVLPGWQELDYLDLAIRIPPGATRIRFWPGTVASHWEGMSAGGEWFKILHSDYSDPRRSEWTVGLTPEACIVTDSLRDAGMSDEEAKRVVGQAAKNLLSGTDVDLLKRMMDCETDKLTKSSTTLEAVERGLLLQYRGARNLHGEVIHLQTRVHEIYAWEHHRGDGRIVCIALVFNSAGQSVHWLRIMISDASRLPEGMSVKDLLVHMLADPTEDAGEDASAAENASEQEEESEEDEP